MKVSIHPHAAGRMPERGTTRAEVEHAVRRGSRSPAKYGRTCFRHTFAYNRKWRGKPYSHKSVLAYAVDLAAREARDEGGEPPEGDWLVLTVVVKFFNRRAR